MAKNSREYSRKYYAEHKEMFRESSRKYREKKRLEQMLKQSNPRLFDMREDFKAGVREEFQAIPTKELTYSQRYYAANKERIRAQQKEARERKKKTEKQRAYYEANKERITAQQRAYHQRKAKEKRMSKTWYGRMALKFKSLFK